MNRHEAVLAIRNALTEMHPDAPREMPPKTVGCSSAGRCSRAIWFDVNRIAKTGHTTAAMSLGTAIHQMLEEWLQEDAQVEVEVDYRPDYPVIGHADLVTDDCVFDYKLVNSNVWSRRKKAADPQNMLQAQLYAYALELPYAAVVYINRGTLDFVVHTTEVYENDVLHELNRFKTIAETVVPPDPWTPHFGVLQQGISWQCRYCPHFDACAIINLEKSVR